MSKLVVGQKLWLVPNERYFGQPMEVTITKVGRKWATCIQGRREYRVDMDTLMVDGGDYTSPAQCYLSRKAHEDHEAAAHAWSDLLRVIDRTATPPAHLVADDIREIQARLEGRG